MKIKPLENFVLYGSSLEDYIEVSVMLQYNIDDFEVLVIIKN